MYKFTVIVEDEADAKFLASDLRGVAATNGIKLLKSDGTQIVDGDAKACEVVETLLPKQLFTKEQRKQVMELVDLREYANEYVCGDGLEIDRADQDLREMSDVDVVSIGILGGIDIFDHDEEWESMLRGKLSMLPADVVDSVVAELNSL